MSNKQNKTQGFNCCFPKNISRREEKKNKKNVRRVYFGFTKELFIDGGK